MHPNDGTTRGQIGAVVILLLAVLANWLLRGELPTAPATVTPPASPLSILATPTLATPVPAP